MRRRLSRWARSYGVRDANQPRPIVLNNWEDTGFNFTEPRIVSLFGYDLDMAPSQHMVVFVYPDRPGMIGKVGTLLGDANINIGSMQVGRKEAGPLRRGRAGATAGTPLANSRCKWRE